MVTREYYNVDEKCEIIAHHFHGNQLFNKEVLRLLMVEYGPVHKTIINVDELFWCVYRAVN
jgi:hypothetical protein